MCCGCNCSPMRTGRSIMKTTLRAVPVAFLPHRGYPTRRASRPSPLPWCVESGRVCGPELTPGSGAEAVHLLAHGGEAAVDVGGGVGLFRGGHQVGSDAI